MRHSSRASQGIDISGITLLLPSSLLSLGSRASAGAKSPEPFFPTYSCSLIPAFRFFLLPSCFLLLAPFFFLPGATKAASIQPRVRIPDVVQVESETVKLSDLLPPDAPTELGEICCRIILGNSPLPASQRVISKGQIEWQLRDFPSILEQLDFPERLTITCKQRRLSPAEIWAAIEAYMAGDGLRAPVAQTCFPSSAARFLGAALNAADLGEPVCATAQLNLQAPVFVTKTDPGLEVKRVEPDRVQRRIRFLLWTSKEPQVLPFYVTVEELNRVAAWGSGYGEQSGASPISTNSHVEPWMTWGGLTDFPASRGDVSPHVTPDPGMPVRQAKSSPIVLVAAGKPAKLVVETATLRLTVEVTPLESGVKGQLIRVRNLDTQRVLEAEVVGEGLLEAEFAGE